ncbi:MAG: ABC transporter permease [Lachnospiraceae bacterium]|nr:ABC transporter permease [Candidatus Equihabitans merdae]
MNNRRGRIGQTFVYFEKFLRIFFYEKGWKNIIFAGVISLLIAFVIGNNMFYNKENLTGYSFTMISACIWIGIFNSIQNICKERAIIKREHRSGLHITSYMAAHMLFQALLCLVEMIVFVVCCSIAIDFPDTCVGLVTGNFIVDFCITIFLCIYAADVLALCVSAIVKDPKTAMTVMPFLLIFQLIFSGSMLNLAGPVEKVTNATISRWGITAICAESNYNELQASTGIVMERMLKNADSYKELRAQMVALEGEKVVKEKEKEMFAEFEEYLKTQTIKERFDAIVDNVIRCWVLLAVFALLYGFVGILFLKRIDKDKR